MTTPKNLVGRQFEHLTVLDKSDATNDNKTNKTLWHCLCVCGNAINVRSRYLLNGHIISCGCKNKQCQICKSIIVGKKFICKTCYSRQLMSKLYQKDKEKRKQRAKDYRRTEVGSFNVTKSNALKDNKEWDLTIDEFKKIRSIGHCFYCLGDLPKVCGGLDRIDNNKGYIVGNIILACENCNKFRGKFISVDEMVAVVKLLRTMRNGKLWG